MHNQLKNYFSFLCFKKISYYCLDINLDDQLYCIRKITFRGQMTTIFVITNLLQGALRRVLHLSNKRFTRKKCFSVSK